MIIAGNAFSQGVSINAVGNPPDASAMLDVSSTSKGLLVPRMTQAQRNAIVGPATSLLIYQTDATPGYYYWDGAAWVPFGGSCYWDRDAVNGYLFPLTLTDKVGIGTNSPGAMLHIKGETDDNSAYSLMTDNNSGFNLFSVRNDGEISFKNYTFPIPDGTANQYLETDGSGNLSWTSPSSSPDLEAVSVYMGSDQAIASGVSVKLLTFNTEVYDDNNNFDNSAGNYSYTCPSDGKYYINVAIKPYPLPLNTCVMLVISVNGTPLKYMYGQQANVASTVASTVDATDILQCSAGDVITFGCRTNVGSITLYGGRWANTLNIYRLGD
ncbi:MAG: hypothetical protein C0592_04280 [Marinilabiliales bacterium]|nr:MAG: hypothetical protein C0592_04280 [Marinilabiliales bacterium]